MRAVFRVDASLQIGTGHVMRCLVLADALNDNGINVEFICRNHEGNLVERIRSKGFNVFELELPITKKIDNKLFHSDWLGTTQKQDAKDCTSFLRKNIVDWLIVDHYGIDEEWQEELKGNYKKLMVIDDLADRSHKCDILLDQTFGRQYQDYKAFVLNSCELLLGSQYALLRPEFAEWRQYSLDRRKKPVFKELLISIGGIDSANMTEQIVKKLEVCNLPSNLKITVVMGIFAPHLETVKTRVNNLPYKSEVRVDVNNMAEIMANADIAIGSSGITTWERCCLGLPAIQFITAKNQSIIGELLARKKAIKLLQNLDQLPEMIEDVISWMKDVTIIAQEVSDGMGSMRVSSKMIDKII